MYFYRGRYRLFQRSNRVWFTCLKCPFYEASTFPIDCIMFSQRLARLKLYVLENNTNHSSCILSFCVAIYTVRTEQNPRTDRQIQQIPYLSHFLAFYTAFHLEFALIFYVSSAIAAEFVIKILFNVLPWRLLLNTHSDNFLVQLARYRNEGVIVFSLF